MIGLYIQDSIYFLNFAKYSWMSRSDDGPLLREPHFVRMSSMEFGFEPGISIREYRGIEIRSAYHGDGR